MSEAQLQQTTYRYRLKGRRAQARVLGGFKKNIRRSWRVERDEEEKEDVLLFEVKIGKHDGIGERKSTLGLKMIPPKSFATHIIVRRSRRRGGLPQCSQGTPPSRNLQFFRHVTQKKPTRHCRSFRTQLRNDPTATV